jgi:tyrosyl-tRNA synthetase
LRVKLGIDPTAPDIHLGHTVVIRKLRQFQDIGHTAVLIIGDYTALIGDPSEREKTRPQLTTEQIEANAQTYLDQVGKLLDMRKVEIVRNGDWFKEFSFKDVLKLASRMTVARMLERDDFSKRYKAEVPISLHEFIYPLMQGFDSVVIKADVELGGTDQTFNLTVGRDMQRDNGEEPQIAVTLPLLVGTDGAMKMSKSYGNYVGVDDSPRDMYGKLMSIPDALMRQYFELLSDVPLNEINELLKKSAHPMEAKKRLALEIVAGYYGKDAAEREAEQFMKVFSAGQLPDEMEQLAIHRSSLEDGKLWIVKLIVDAGFAPSNSEARRLVSQGAVSIAGLKIQDPSQAVAINEGDVLKVGKRRFGQIKIVV